MDAKMLTKKKVDFVFGRKVRSEMDGADGFNTYEMACVECYEKHKDDCWQKEEEEDAGEMTIYSIIKDMKVGKITGTYYQTYGGGPEGGFLETKDGWYELDRTWHQPWKVTKRPGIVVLFNSENNVPYEMRVIV